MRVQPQRSDRAILVSHGSKVQHPLASLWRGRVHGTHFMTAGHKSEQITKIMIFGSMRDRLAIVTNVAHMLRESIVVVNMGRV